MGLCAVPCAPTDTGACVGTCSFASDTVTVCDEQVGSGAQGAACTTDIDCIRALACDDVAKVCTRSCRAGSSDCGLKPCLTAGEPPLSYGGMTYGYCGL
jgi:hypothetical protein